MTAVFETVGEARPNEHLSTEVLARLREGLLHELRFQVDQAYEQERTVAELMAEPRAAVGPLEVDRDIAEVVVEWSREAEEDIDAALARMDDGTYGICEQCEASIPVERLEAIPHARFCVSCQGRREAMR